MRGGYRQTNQRAEWHESSNAWNATWFLSKTKTFRQRTAKPINVRFWPLADTSIATSDVRFRG